MQELPAERSHSLTDQGRCSSHPLHSAATPGAFLRSDFWLLLLLFTSFRLLTLLLFRPGGFIRDWSDFDTFLGIASLSDYGLYPFFDFWLEWPPLVPWLMVGAYKLSLLLPPWEEPRFWFITWLGLIFVLFEAGNFGLIYRLAQQSRRDPAQIKRILWLYAGLFPPVYAMLGFFDGLALFFILLSLNLILQQRVRFAAIAIGLGIMVKVTPVLMLPVALKYVWLRHRQVDRRLLVEWAWLGGLVGGTVLVLATPFLWPDPAWLLAFGRALLGRSSWETVWAVLEGYYGFGRVAGDRLNPAETNFAIHPAGLPWGMITLGFGLLYGLVFRLKADLTRPRRLLAWAGLMVSLFLLYSKGYSPQFLVYILPFIILLLPNWTGLGYSLALTALNVLEQPIYFVIFPPDQFPAESWLLTAIVTARFIIWLALSVEFGRLIWRKRSAISHQPSAANDLWSRVGARWSGVRLMRWLVAAVLLVGGLSMMPKMLSAYERVQLAHSPYQPVIGFLRSQMDDTPQTLILTEQNLYRQLYPHLRKDYQLKLAGGDSDFPAAPSVGQLMEGQKRAWLLVSGDRGETVAEEMAKLAQLVAVYEVTGVGSLRVFDTSHTAKPPAPPARSELGIQLLGYQVSPIGSTLELTLYWQTNQSLPADYTVFSQLLDQSGQQVAGHDSPPANGSAPTSNWQTYQLIVDQHHLLLPENLTPGQYQIIVGMYDADLNRLMMILDPQNQMIDDAINLKTIKLP